jgi:hypothetical protein
MIISYQKGFIFIHVFKVAGSSIETALDPYAYKITLWERILRKAARQLNLPLYYKWHHFTRHVDAREVKAKLPPAVYDSFFKFAFVRNPWDWLVSGYHYILQNPSHYQHDLVKSFSGFPEFVESQLFDRTQKYLLTDAEGHLIVDFVGRYENLQADFQQACQIIGITAVLPHTNPSSHRPYRDYYDIETRQRVAEIYGEDIEFFGYTF